MDRNRNENEKFFEHNIDICTENLNRLWSSIIVNILAKNNISKFYISPGMRNAPLIAAIKKHKHSRIFIGIDERAQAFRALGAAKVENNPSVLICTSGTAAANYYPAIIEAYKSKVPLIIISADRPFELIEANANQTIDQINLFKNFINKFINLGSPTEEVTPRTLCSILNNTVINTIIPIYGPVHINISFREPLDSTNQQISQSYIDDTIDTLTSKIKNNKQEPESGINISDYNLNINDFFIKSKTQLLSIGRVTSDQDRKAIINFVKTTKILTIVDITSSTFSELSQMDNVIPSIEYSSIEKQLCSNAPDLIIHLGHRFTSKKYYTFLSKLKNTLLIHANDNIDYQDTSFMSTYNIMQPIKNIIKNIDVKNVRAANKSFIGISKVLKEGISNNISKNSKNLSYPSLANIISNKIEANSALYLSNSTVIRSFDCFQNFKETNIEIISNRGVSGIEGLIASAVGYTEASNKKTTLVIGDISFLHDLNSLMLLTNKKIPLTIVIANNNQGGIFNLLPLTIETEVIDCMTTPHNYNFELVAEQFNISYTQCETINDFQNLYVNAINSNNTCIIEANFDDTASTELYKKLKKL